MESNQPTECRDCCAQRAAAVYLSPGLARGSDRGRRAIELKFLLPKEVASPILDRAQAELQIDPFADRESGQYKVCSLYLDTLNYDIYHRTPATGGAKFRFRRYNDSDEIFLERKHRQRGVVSKQRDRVTFDQIIQAQAIDSPIWTEVQSFGLLPSCAVEYNRDAFISEHADAPFRVTIDNDLLVHRFTRQNWEELSTFLRAAQEGPTPRAASLRPLVQGFSVVEFKFMDTLPVPLKRWIEDFQIAPFRFSKYRASLNAPSEASATPDGARK
jgi:hypothetical protein